MAGVLLCSIQVLGVLLSGHGLCFSQEGLAMDFCPFSLTLSPLAGQPQAGLHLQSTRSPSSLASPCQRSWTPGWDSSQANHLAKALL